MMKRIAILFSCSILWVACAGDLNHDVRPSNLIVETLVDAAFYNQLDNNSINGDSYEIDFIEAQPNSTNLLWAGVSVPTNCGTHRFTLVAQNFLDRVEPGQELKLFLRYSNSESCSGGESLQLTNINLSFLRPGTYALTVVNPSNERSFSFDFTVQ